VSGQLHALVNIPLGNSHWYPLVRMLDGLRSQSGHDSEERNSAHPAHS